MRRKLAFVLVAVALALAVCATELLHAEEPKYPEWSEWKPSPHHGQRRAAAITAIILHYTAGGSLSGTVNWFQDPMSKVSAHYVVGKDGKVRVAGDLDDAEDVLQDPRAAINILSLDMNLKAIFNKGHRSTSGR